MTEYPFQNKRYAFTVCRIEPENNIHIILEAFAENSPFPVVIVGNWSVGEYGRNLREKYRGSKHIFMLDPIYDQTELNALRGSCYIYLHGHSCGGTNPSLVEAMYLGLPVLAFDVNFNRATTENQALYFNSISELKECCSSITPEVRAENASKMKEIANRRYTWKRIAERYAKIC